MDAWVLVATVSVSRSPDLRVVVVVFATARPFQLQDNILGPHPRDTAREPLPAPVTMTGSDPRDGSGRPTARHRSGPWPTDPAQSAPRPYRLRGMDNPPHPGTLARLGLPDPLRAGHPVRPRPSASRACQRLRSRHHFGTATLPRATNRSPAGARVGIGPSGSRPDLELSGTPTSGVPGPGFGGASSGKALSSVKALNSLGRTQ